MSYRRIEVNVLEKIREIIALIVINDLDLKNVESLDLLRNGNRLASEIKILGYGIGGELDLASLCDRIERRNGERGRKRKLSPVKAVAEIIKIYNSGA